jgi:hypothetical protein
MPKKKDKSLVDPEEPEGDEEEEEEEEDENSEYAPGSEPGKLGQRDLSRVLAKYDWADGRHYIDLYRDRPYEAKGKPCHGFVDRIHEPIDVAFIERYHGGKTYHILICGPHPKTDKDGVIVGRVNGIIVAGDVKLGGRAAREEAEGEEGANGEGKGGSGGASYLGDPVATRLADATIEESRDLRRHLLKGGARGGKESELSVVLSQQAKAMELSQQRADSEAKRQNDMILALLSGRDNVPDSGEGYREIVEQMRRDMDSARAEHARELRAAAERQERDLRDMEQRSREQVDRMRDEASKERERLRDEADRREQRMRDEWGTREQGLRDSFDGRYTSQRENSEARERGMLDQLNEARERARDFESRLMAMTGERDGARLDAVRLEAVLSTKEDPKPPLQALQEVVALGNEVASLTGQAPVAETPVDQAVKVLQSEPAQRVAAGIQGWLSSLSGKQPPAPPAAGLQEWQQISAQQNPQLQPQPQPQGQPQPQRVVRRRRRQPTPEGEMEMPPSAEEGGGGEVPVPVEAQPPAPPPSEAPAPGGGPDAQSMLRLITSSAEEDKAYPQFIQELAASIGGDDLQALAYADFGLITEGIENLSGEPMTFQMKQYLRGAIPVLREMLQTQA